MNRNMNRNMNPSIYRWPVNSEYKRIPLKRMFYIAAWYSTRCEYYRVRCEAIL